jgi:hypothetical protein
MTESIIEIERYFLTKHPVFVFQPYPNYLESGVRKCIDSIGRAAARTAAPSFWIESQATLKGLTQSVNGQQTLFPHLRPVWNDVRTSTINGAIVILNRKKVESKKTMSVLGLTAHEEIVVLVAPLITFCVIIYLLTHMLHICSIADQNLDVLSKFPWIVLFRGFLSRALTYGSLLFLPAIANTVIIIRAWDIRSSFTWIGFLLAMGSLIVSWKTLYEINCLRRDFQCNLLDKQA